VGAETLQLGSVVPPELRAPESAPAAPSSPPASSAAASSESAQSGKTLALHGNHPFADAAKPSAGADITSAVRPQAPTPRPEVPRGAAALAADEKVEGAAPDALHDAFFSAGDEGKYSEATEQAAPRAFEDDDDFDAAAPRLAIRTPEQEQRRNRLMRIVGIVVGVVLGVFAVAMIRGTSGRDDAPTRPSAEQPVAAPPAPNSEPPREAPLAEPRAASPVEAPPPPEPPRAEVEPEPPIESPPAAVDTKRTAKEPRARNEPVSAAPKPAGERVPAPRPTPPPRRGPAAQPRPAGDAAPPEPAPARPPMVSFPD
jgi:hypothetical protein